MLAYRSRKVLDVAADDVKKIDIARPGESFTLERKDNDWQLDPADAGEGRDVQGRPACPAS